MVSGHSLARITGQTIGLLLACNLIFWIAQPGLLDRLGRFSLYGSLFERRTRLPFGEDITADHNLTLNNVPAMMASHAISQPKPIDEFRVVVLGDSATWGWRLRPKETITAQLNQHGLTLGDGSQVVFYNLGYPVLSLTKDVLLLEQALAFEPDLILWIVTLESLAADQQVIHPLVVKNPRLLAAAGLKPLPVEEDVWWRETIIGRRRDLADLLRLQIVGGAWSATGIDQHIPPDFEPVKNDLSDDRGWHRLEQPADMTAEGIALPLLVETAGRTEIPIVVVNEPIFIASGANSDLRYNSLYPRWAYDRYRVLLADGLNKGEIPLIDMWDSVPAEQFTDSPVHLTPAGVHLFADRLVEHLAALNFNE